MPERSWILRESKFEISEFGPNKNIFDELVYFQTSKSGLAFISATFNRWKWYSSFLPRLYLTLELETVRTDNFFQLQIIDQLFLGSS